MESDATHLDYGSALLSKIAGAPSPGQPPPVANDTRVVLGKLDQKLYASAEPDNTKAATRLASDMGEFFMPYPGTRVNQETTALSAKACPGGASYYEVKFSDASKPNGQIWAASGRSVGTECPAGRRRTSAGSWCGWALGTTRWTRRGRRRWPNRSCPLLAPPAAPAPAPGAPAPGPAPGHRLRHPPRERRLLPLALRHPPRRSGSGACAPVHPHRRPPPTPGQPAGGNGPAPAPGAVST